MSEQKHESPGSPRSSHSQTQSDTASFSPYSQSSTAVSYSSEASSPTLKKSSVGLGIKKLHYADEDDPHAYELKGIVHTPSSGTSIDLASERGDDVDAIEATDGTAFLGHHDLDDDDDDDAAARGSGSRKRCVQESETLVRKTNVVRELLYTWRHGGFNVITLVAQRSLTLSAIFVVGRLGKDELAGVSIAVMTVYVTGFAPIRGFATALDTLCGQAYGSGRYLLVGLSVQRMLLFLHLMSVPIALFWLHATSFFLTFTSPELAHLAGAYLRVAAWALPGYASYECGKAYLQAQSIFMPMSIVVLVVAPLNLLLNWALVFWLGWGYVGSPITMVIVQYMQAGLIWSYVRWLGGMECWPKWSWDVCRNWGSMTRIALLNFLMYQAEILCWEVLILAAARFSATHIAATAVVSNTVSLFFQIPNGFANTTATRISNYIGASLPSSARVAYRAAVLNGLFFATLDGATALIGRDFIPRVMSAGDEDVITMYQHALWIIAPLQFVDAYCATFSAVLRGLGLQRFGCYTVVIGYYVIGLPISFYMCFGSGWELEGLWVGIFVGMLFVCGVEWLYIAKWPNVFENAVLDAKKRTKAALASD